MKWWRDKQYQKPILPPNPQAVDASHLLKDMNQILQKTDLSEAEKAQRYGETLFKLQNSLEKTHTHTKMFKIGYGVNPPIPYTNRFVALSKDEKLS